jgi:hypothetical protein
LRVRERKMDDVEIVEGSPTATTKSRLLLLLEENDIQLLIGKLVGLEIIYKVFLTKLIREWFSRVNVTYRHNSFNLCIEVDVPKSNTTRPLDTYVLSGV